jgi:hypothetical protein
MRAIIGWMSKEQGGRDKPPAGVGAPSYLPTVRFTEPNEAWPPPVMWTFVISKLGEVDGPNTWLADAKFLVDEAPHDVIRPGRTFELYEGPRCVARGRFVEEPEGGNGDAPAEPSRLPTPIP